MARLIWDSMQWPHRHHWCYCISPCQDTGNRKYKATDLMADWRHDWVGLSVGRSAAGGCNGWTRWLEGEEESSWLWFLVVVLLASGIFGRLVR